MKDTSAFEKFLDSAYGRRTISLFDKEKSQIENPPKFIISRFHGKIKPKNYLDIGGGTGKRTVEIIKGLGCRHTDFLEPSKRASDEFVKLAKSHGVGNISIIRSSFEDFSRAKKYDFITSIHSWYYIDLESLQKLYKMLAPSGIACIFIDSKDDTIKRMQDICEIVFLNKPSNNAEDICKYLEKRGIKYSVYNYDGVLSGLLKNNNFTQRARIIASLVAYRKWSKISASVKQKILELFRETDQGHGTYPSRRCLIVVKK
ncbi:MAG: methyltransferase domain-containing protein [Candidatus Aenigmarchaeota archaeon]|nr:methyltransferase domain-containing protein [Candidatus Aenigmarchaeota archaeon]